MAKTRKATTQTRKRTTTPRERGATRPVPSVGWEIPWGTTNLIILAVGIGVIFIGFMVMSSAIADDPISDKSIWNNSASTTIAPILLTIAYCVIIPIAIWWRKKGEERVEPIEAAE